MVAADKSAVRARTLVNRRRLTEGDLAGASAALTRRALELPELHRPRTVAAYVSVGTEPGTRDLLRGLAAAGVRVLLPVLREDGDLDWVTQEPGTAFVRTAYGLLEPTGARSGPGAVTEADVVVVPGLAGDDRGARLGRGGGSYDRVLGRLSGDAVAVLLLHDGEVIPSVPEEAHDRRVSIVLTPSAALRAGAAR